MNINKGNGISRESANAMIQTATDLFQQGRMHEAEKIAHQVLNIYSEHADAYHLLGLIAAYNENYISSIQLITSAIQFKPKYVEALINRGHVLTSLGRMNEALADYDLATQLNPLLHAAHFRKGNLLWDLGRLDEALVSYERAANLDPNHAAGQFNRANALRVMGHVDDALSAYKMAIQIKADYAEAYVNLGTLLLEMGRIDEALMVSRYTVNNFPQLCEAYNLHGNVLTSLSRVEEALNSYEQAIKINATYAEALSNCGALLFEIGHYEQAKDKCLQALKFTPHNDRALNCYIYSITCTCDWSDITLLHKRVSEGIRESTYIVNPFISIYFPLTPHEQLECAKNYVKSRFPTKLEPLWSGQIYDHSRIKIGYMSADFNNHATAQLITGMLELHDRTKFEVIGISFGKDISSPMHNRLRKAFDQFIDVSAASDFDAAKLIRNLEIDIAVDLKGHTKESRPGILARRPAPVQVNYLGFPGTMGAEFIDYIIVDPVVVPAELYSSFLENVVNMPECYQANDSKRIISTRHYLRKDFGLPDDSFVFCCFNNNYKFTNDLFNIWLRLLKKTTGSVLWLLSDNESARNNLRHYTLMNGVDPNRLVFATRMNVKEHLARHHLADLFLDTLPCNAHTTASDALWTGLPVLTCTGDTFAGRVATSLLYAVGLPEMVTESLEEYESLAVKLATDPILTSSIRKKLGRNRLTAPLFDTDRFRRHLEAAYVQMWKISQDREAPRAFSIIPLQ